MRYKTTPEGMRTCSVKTCGKTYPATTDYFHVSSIRLKNGNIWHGLRPECKFCRNEYRRFKRSQKKRYCPDCGRDLDKYQHFCSECSLTRRELSNTIHGHTLDSKQHRKEYKYEYQKQYRLKMKLKKQQESAKNEL
jgi:predicted amidophosphoribosyltransferase